MTNIIAELEKYSEKLVNSGLVVGAGGNLSMRDGEYMYISPSGYDLLEVKQESWVQVHIDTGKVLSKLKPSSEIEMHLECFRNNNYIKAVLDRKSTRLNSSHVAISYAVFCLQKKK